MFRPEVYQKDWIWEKRQELGNCDPGLLEKSIYALTLLGLLQRSGLPFIFKGGTSLMLHLPNIQRLSIDIDILTPAGDGELERVVAEIGQTAPFIGKAEDDRGTRGLPRRRHFKFLFKSPFDLRADAYVLLDVVQEKEIVHRCIKKPIQTSFLEPEDELMVELPRVESLLGDKLTAFAPNTTGVPYRRKDGSVGQVMQVAKQLFDVGILFEHAREFLEVAKTYDAVQQQEVGYRGRAISREESLDDSFKACLGIIAHKPKLQEVYPDTALLLDGFTKLKGHLTRPKFQLNDQRTLAGRTACLAASLKRGRAITRYTRSSEQIEALKAASLKDHSLSWLDGIRNINDEAYFYMHQALS